MPNKTKVCNFCYKVNANKNVIVGNLCDKFENILIQLVYASGTRPLVGNSLRGARSKVRSVSQWLPTTIKNAQHYGSFVVVTPSEEFNVIYDTDSSNLLVPNSDCCG